MLVKENRKMRLVQLALLVFAFLPKLSSVSYPPQDTAFVMKEALTQVSVSYLWLNPIIHVATVTLFVALYRFGSRVGREATAFIA